MEKDITYPIDDVNDDYGFYFTYTFNEDGTGRYKSYYYYAVSYTHLTLPTKRIV